MGDGASDSKDLEKNKGQDSKIASDSQMKE